MCVYVCVCVKVYILPSIVLFESDYIVFVTIQAL